MIPAKVLSVFSVILLVNGIEINKYISKGKENFLIITEDETDQESETETDTETETDCGTDIETKTETNCHGTNQHQCGKSAVCKDSQCICSDNALVYPECEREECYRDITCHNMSGSTWSSCNSGKCQCQENRGRVVKIYFLFRPFRFFFFFFLMICFFSSDKRFGKKQTF